MTPKDVNELLLEDPEAFEAHVLELVEHAVPSHALGSGTDDGTGAEMYQLERIEKRGFETARVLERIDLDRIAREGIPQIDWLCEGLLARNDVAVFGARPGDGKSTFALALSHAIAAGTDFLGSQGMGKPQPVVYLDAEAGTVDLARHALRVGPPIPDLHLFSAPGIALTRPGDAASVEREIVLRKAALLVLDSATSCFGLKDENDAAHVARVFAMLNAWRDRYGVAILVLHHLVKGGGDNVGRSPMDRLRGSSAFAALASVLYYGERPSGGRWLDIKCAGKARGRPSNFSVRVELVGDGDRMTLTNLGEPKHAEGVQEASSSAVRDFLANSPDYRAKRGAIVRALADRWSDDTIDRALRHLKVLKVIEQLPKGYWQLSAAAPGH